MKKHIYRPTSSLLNNYLLGNINEQQDSSPKRVRLALYTQQPSLHLCGITEPK